MKKRILSFVLILIMTVGFLPTVSVADGVVTSGSCGQSAFWTYNPETTTLTISGTGKMDDFSAVNKTPWYAFYKDITDVVVQDGIESVGKYSFTGFENLKNVTLADTITKLGAYLFSGCKNLTTVDLPKSIKSIPDDGFHSSGLTSITIPDGVFTIFSDAFSYCDNLEFVSIPASVTTIEDRSFEKCKNLKRIELFDIEAYCNIYFGSSSCAPFVNGTDLYMNGKVVTEITIPATINIVPTSLFMGCTSIKKVTFSEGVTRIRDYAFKNCTNLESLTISNSLNNFGREAFENCNVKRADIASMESWFENKYSTNGHPLGGTDLYLNGQLVTSYEFPEGSTKIPSYALYGCKSITSVTIPDTVKSIGKCAFTGTSITSIEIPDSVTEIYDSAFEGVPLTSIEIPDSVTKIYGSAFAGTPLTSIEIPDSVTAIESGAFSGCTMLSYVRLPSKLTKISDSLFKGCTSLKKIALPTSIWLIESNAFRNSGLTVIYMANAYDVRYDAFRGTPLKYVYYKKFTPNVDISSGNEPLEKAESILGATGLPDCVFDDENDNECNICGSSRCITHDYISTFDRVSHFKACTKCNTVIEKQSHSFDNNCDENCDCGYVRDNAHNLKWVVDEQNSCISAGKKHRECTDCDYKDSFDTPVDKSYNKNDHPLKIVPFDSIKHVLACMGCNVTIIEYYSHSFDNDNDMTCDECGYERDHVHKFKVEYTTESHYEVCTVCSEKLINKAHVFSADCDPDCSVCGFTRSVTHAYGAYTSDKNATSQKDGTKTRVCTVCGTKDTVTDDGSKLKDTSKIFKDVKAKAWYKQYVDYAVAYGIFSGTDKISFSPNANITRSQFVQVLANIEGVDTSDRNVKTQFSDVPSKKWYTAAVKWASENKIVNGVGGGKFDPNANVTREQMCVMLTNFAKFKGITLKTVEAKENFTDDAKISKWAKNAVYVCQQADIVNGKGENKFDPQGTGTRAEASVIFTKFHKDYIN